MNIFKNYIRILLCGISVLYLLYDAPQINAVERNQEKLYVAHINNNKIIIHEQYVIRAQKRYRYVKPALTLCGVSSVMVYFWYTSSSLSREEINKIKNIIVDENKTTNFDANWVKSNATSLGGVAVELIGGALIIPPLSELIDKLTGCVHIMSSLELYDKEYTHCNALITQIARDMQMSIASQAAGKPVAIGVAEIVNAGNRLIHRMEKLIGFMRVEVSKFPKRSLRKEAQMIEKRLIVYANELCTDLQYLIDAPVLQYAAILELIVQFAQRYAQEMQRFSFLEQDARESA